MVLCGRAIIILSLLLNSSVVYAAHEENVEDQKKREEFKSKIFKEETLRDPKEGLADEDFEPLLGDEVLEKNEQQQQQVGVGDIGNSPDIPNEDNQRLVVDSVDDVGGTGTRETPIENPEQPEPAVIIPSIGEMEIDRGNLGEEIVEGETARKEEIDSAARDDILEVPQGVGDTVGGETTVGGEVARKEEIDSTARDDALEVPQGVGGASGHRSEEVLEENEAVETAKETKSPASLRRNAIGPVLSPVWSNNNAEDKSPEDKNIKKTKEEKEPKNTKSLRRSGMGGEDIRAVVPVSEKKGGEEVEFKAAEPEKKEKPRSLRRSGMGGEDIKAVVPVSEKRSEDTSSKDISEKKEKAAIKKEKRKFGRNAIGERDMGSLIPNGGKGSVVTASENQTGEEGIDDEDYENIEPLVQESDWTVSPAAKRGNRARGEQGKNVLEDSRTQTSFGDDLPAVRKRKTTGSAEELKTGGEQGILEKIYNITDTDVSDDFLFSSEYADLLKESEKIKLKKVEMVDERDIPLIRTSAKNIISFRDSDIPDELLTYKRSEANAHIPPVLSVDDMRDMAKKAIIGNDLAALRGLVEKTGDPDFLVDKNRTVLEFAIESDSYAIVRYLIYSGSSINRQGLDLNSPLHMAVSSNNIALVKLLIENGSDINGQNSFGETPLMLAIIKNYDGIAHELLKKGADVNVKNQGGETAYNLCLKHNRGKIQKYLASVIKTERVLSR
ncbi:MAG: ankyrin repeat domain-containing protein [Rickettsiales bacterium]|jgi:hypothetical protein|nr:ankyrin repeat domain-containing protein [Rickettsiales bacterium]